MNQPITSSAAQIAVPVPKSTPVASASTIAKPAIVISWARPSTPIPMILPARSWRGRIADSSISTIRDDFSSITPVATHSP